MDINSNASLASSFYEDILLKRRLTSDLRWAAREWEEETHYIYRKRFTKSEMLSIILKSDRVLYTINKMLSEGYEKRALLNQVKSILEDMSHTLDIGMIRKFGVSLPKIMKKIYNKIFVNSSGIIELKKIIKDVPVLLLPTHRSYADFLLISYIAFHYNLPLPVIAAGMDFMSMAIIGDMLRGSGAFYIRRSFQDDALYWAVFKEYVQLLLCKGGHPMEFFLEGTRSRSGKALPPKLGLLGCVTECWLRGKLPDIVIIPISISYNRTLEEKLYAYEMLGVPKPKESTSGLLKAMKILNENFGNIYVHFGCPISVREFMSPRVKRHIFSSPFHLTPVIKQERCLELVIFAENLVYREGNKRSPFKPISDGAQSLISDWMRLSMLDACEQLGLHILRKLQMNCVISVWSLACISFIRYLWRGIWSIPYQLLCQETISLAELAKVSGGVVEGCHTNENVEDNLIRTLKDHMETVVLSDGNIQIQQVNGKNEGSKKASKNNGDFTFNPSTIGPAVTHLLVQYYVNQTLHLFVRKALVSYAMQSYKETQIPIEYLLSRYTLLTSIFGNDFIFEPGLHKQDLMETLDFLSKENILTLSGRTILLRINPNSSGKSVLKQAFSLEFYVELLQPYFMNYQASLIVASMQSWESEASFLASFQAYIETSVRENLFYSALSQDICKHSFKMLINMGALRKINSSNDNVVLIPDLEKISCLQEVLKPTLIMHNFLRPKL